MDKPIIFYDGFCNLCNFSVRLIAKCDSKRIFLFSPLQSSTSKTILNVLSKEPNTVILSYKDELYFRSNAILKIATLLKFPYSLFSAFYAIPKPIRDYIYTLIANNRLRIFGSKDYCSVNISTKKRSPEFWTPFKQ